MWICGQSYFRGKPKELGTIVCFIPLGQIKVAAADGGS
jgi:hypothetical protein